LRHWSDVMRKARLHGSAGASKSEARLRIHRTADGGDISLLSGARIAIRSCRSALY